MRLYETSTAMDFARNEAAHDWAAHVLGLRGIDMQQIPPRQKAMYDRVVKIIEDTPYFMQGAMDYYRHVSSPPMHEGKAFEGLPRACKLLVTRAGWKELGLAEGEIVAPDVLAKVAATRETIANDRGRVLNALIDSWTAAKEPSAPAR